MAGGCKTRLFVPGDAGIPLGVGGEPVDCLTGPGEAGTGTAGELAGKALGD